MPASRDETAWRRVEGDHSEDASYVRSPLAPTAQPTDEARTEEEIENFEAVNEANEPEYDATEGAVAAAEELGVDLANVTGTGAEGRITKADVEGAAG